MKTPSFPRSRPAAAPRHRRAQAFTVSEMMVAVFIFAFLVLGIVYALLAGMRHLRDECGKAMTTLNRDIQRLKDKPMEEE